MPNPNAGYQEEFFKEFAQGNTHARQRFHKEALFLDRKVSFEQILFVLIGVLISLVITYSLGVERGKRISKVYDIPIPEVKLATAALPQTPQNQDQKNYTIQVVTYRDKKSAEKLIEQLRSGGRKTFLIPKGELLAICIGEYPTSAEASKAAKIFRNQFPDCFVRNL